MNLTQILPLAVAAAMLLSAGPTEAATHYDPDFSFDPPTGWVITEKVEERKAPHALRVVRLIHRGKKDSIMTMTVRVDHSGWGYGGNSIAGMKRGALEVGQMFHHKAQHMGDLTVKGVPGFYERYDYTIRKQSYHGFSVNMLQGKVVFQLIAISPSGKAEAVLERDAKEVLRSWKWGSR